MIACVAMNKFPKKDQGSVQFVNIFSKEMGGMVWMPIGGQSMNLLCVMRISGDRYALTTNLNFTYEFQKPKQDSGSMFTLEGPL